MYYAIEIIGSARKRYTIKQVFPNGTNPVDGKIYRTEEDARSAAARLGLKIEKTGDLWEILPAVR